MNLLFFHKGYPIYSLNTIIALFFASLSTWIIFAAVPYFRFGGMYPQVDTQLIFLHSLCGLMCIYYSIKLYIKKNELRNLNHPLILIPLLIAFISLISSALGKNFNKSLLGAPQIGQGVFWYLDLSIMSIVFSQLANIKTAKLILFINLLFVTFVVSFFTFSLLNSTQ